MSGSRPSWQQCRLASADERARSGKGRRDGHRRDLAPGRVIGNRKGATFLRTAQRSRRSYPQDLASCMPVAGSHSRGPSLQDPAPFPPALPQENALLRLSRFESNS